MPVIHRPLGGGSVPDGVACAFKQRGWADDRIERICNGNFRRVLAAVWC